ncbi:MAG: prepilin-type N-terminal cleavage/methylation domain-containing protein [Pseudomonadota bacterium]
MFFRKAKNNKGFTLIELIVVIIIMSVMLVFATPRLSGFIFPDDTNEIIRWLVVKARLLRNNAVQHQKHYYLNIDIDNSRLWVTDESVDTEEALKKAYENSYPLPESVRLLDVEFPGRGKVLQGTVEISFNKQGYADPAIIHIGGPDDRKVSLMIEAFLPSVKWVEEYVEAFR